MDPGAIGIVGGTAIIVFLVITVTCYEKRHSILRYCRETYKRKQERHQQQQPLLPLTTTISNPMLVRSPSRQWKVKELVETK